MFGKKSKVTLLQRRIIIKIFLRGKWIVGSRGEGGASGVERNTSK